MVKKKNIGQMLGLLFILVVATIYFVNQSATDVPKVTVKQAEKESCTNCHTSMTGFAPAHAPKRIGCVSCHQGNPESIEKETAHKDMVVIPGNLSDVSNTCSSIDCHPGIDLRVKHSLMNTMSGIIAVDKYAFGEVDDLNGHHDIKNLGFSAADTHLRNLCASCHLGREKLKTGAIHEKSRGGGCNACHLNYSDNAQKAHEAYFQSEKTELPKIHPTLSLKITNNHCFGCHSRSGRISTNYEGWHETKLRREEVTDEEKYRVLEDKRVFTYIQEDVHHTQGMDCIDCHGSLDVMGDGVSYAHEEEAVRARCEDCHTDEVPETISFEKLNEENKSIVRLRGMDQDARFVVSSYSKMPLVNVFLDDRNHLTMMGKNNGKQYTLTAPGEKCTKGGVHSDITCSACHTTWAPQCIQCHTSYDKEKQHFDLLDRKTANGKWIENGNHYLADFPALGVIEEAGKRKIKTFIPGMIMTLDQSGFSGDKGDKKNYRLYAPASPHTIATKGQNCKNCHNNPVVLGYGRGKLTYKNGKWSFQPQFEKWSQDSLPLDAWIGFLQENNTAVQSTRTNARPFSLEEQRKILKAGACLTCHREDSQVATMMLRDFEGAMEKMSEECAVGD